MDKALDFPLFSADRGAKLNQFGGRGHAPEKSQVALLHRRRAVMGEGIDAYISVRSRPSARHGIDGRAPAEPYRGAERHVQID
jgi:hypothetical protein